MIHFPPLRTERLDVQLRELRIRESIELAGIPASRPEQALSRLLRCVVAERRGNTPPIEQWTQQERLTAQAHYLSCTLDHPNFAVGTGTLSDYLDGQNSVAPMAVDAGVIDGQRWIAGQITGSMAEALEAVCASRQDWVIAEVAARMREDSADDPPGPDPAVEFGAYCTWLTGRMQVFGAMPESDFEQVFAAMLGALDPLHHLFRLSVSADGFVVLPVKEGAQSLAPATFPVSACIGELARSLGARPDQRGGEDGPQDGDAVPRSA